MSWFLSIDIGTTSVKAAAISDNGRLLVDATSSYETARPAPNQVEQDPHDWWTATQTAVHRILASGAVDRSALRGIGLSGMAATHVLLDEQHRVLRPAVLWQDTRAQAEAAELVQVLGDEAITRCFGAELPLTASAQAARMLWLSRHDRELWDRTHVVLGSKDYILLQLTGALATDPTSSSGFANLVTGELHPEMAQATSFDPVKLPHPRQPQEVAGVVSAKAEAATGIPRGTPVAAGMIDSWCNMLGAGITQTGQGFDTAGTAEVVGLGAPRQPAAPKTRHNVYRLPFLTGIDTVYGVTQCGTDAFTWFAEAFGQEERERARAGGPSIYALLGEAAAEVAAGANGLVFLPYLEGERAPFADTRARASFLGVQRQHRKPHFARAVLEGVAYSVRHVLEACEEICGVRAEQLVVTSGGARSALWNQIKADVLKRPLVTLKVSDAGSVGAAILAAVAANHYSLDEAVRELVHTKDVIEPRSRAATVYSELYQIYRAAAEAVAEIQHQLADIQSRKEP